jgi:hypothetical protein
MVAVYKGDHGMILGGHGLVEVAFIGGKMTS